MKKHINLELSSVLGTGAVGPVLAVLTATLCTAFGSFVFVPSWVYPSVMLFLSGLSAVFPVVKSGYSKILKVALWPLATLIIFASAWTSSTGMSIGEEKMRGGGVAVESLAGGGFPMAPTSVAMMDPSSVVFMVKEDKQDAGRITGKFFKRVR